jgi:hypothetical protein
LNPTTELTVTTGELAVPGARLYHEVRGRGPAVLLLGSPMDADSFAPLADLLADDHTVVTMDPRAIHRSSVKTATRTRPDDAGRRRGPAADPPRPRPAAAFGSSGGAVTLLALAQARPTWCTRWSPHERRWTSCSRTARRRRAVADAIVGAYLTEGRAGGLAAVPADADIDLPEPVFAEIFGLRSRAPGAPTRTSSSATRCADHRVRPTSTHCAPGGPDRRRHRCGVHRAGLRPYVAGAGRALGIEPVIFPATTSGSLRSGGFAGASPVPSPALNTRQSCDRDEFVRSAVREGSRRTTEEGTTRRGR